MIRAILFDAGDILYSKPGRKNSLDEFLMSRGYEASSHPDPIAKALRLSAHAGEISEHLFFKLSNFTGFLREWTASGTLNKAVSNKLNEWLEQGLKDWDISRDGPYFGFKIPGHADKFFYVWLDAPIGYIASLQNHCSDRAIDHNDYWCLDSDSEVHHFIGKDIVNFHALFYRWPEV